MYKRKYQKGVIHLLLLLAVVFFAIVGIGYYAYQNGQLRKSTPTEETNTTPISDESVNRTIIDDQSYWKDYINESYGWSLRYPSNWYVYDKGFRYLDANGQEQWVNPKGSVFIQSEPFPSYISEGTEFSVNGLVVQFDPTNVHLNDRIAELKDLSTDLVLTTETQIGGKSAIKSIHDSNISKLPQDQIRRNLGTIYWIDYPKGEFLILTISHPNTDGEGGHDEVYDQILSTFQFTK
jgi:hypothetical protein